MNGLRRCGVYTQWNTTQPQKNNAICSNMDGTKDCHTKSEKGRQILYDITYIWNLI